MVPPHLCYELLRSRSWSWISSSEEDTSEEELPGGQRSSHLQEGRLRSIGFASLGTNGMHVQWAAVEVLH